MIYFLIEEELIIINSSADRVQVAICVRLPFELWSLIFDYVFANLWDTYQDFVAVEQSRLESASCGVQSLACLRRSHWSHSMAFGPCEKIAGGWLHGAIDVIFWLFIELP
jgi:hypothetical protein